MLWYAEMPYARMDCAISAVYDILNCMGRTRKILNKVLSGRADANIPFDDLRNLLKSFGFNERIKGSHHIFFHPDIEEILNLQPKGSKAKPYQVKQVRAIILKYGFRDTGHDQI